VEEHLNKKPLTITLKFVQLKIHLNLSTEKANKVLLPKKEETKISFHVQSAPENSQLIELINMKLCAKELEETSTGTASKTAPITIKKTNTP